VFSTATGTDSVIADGAISPVLASDGRVAFVRGTRPDYYANERYLGTIEATALDDPTVASTLLSTPGNYRLVGWAGDSLLYYVLGEGETLDLFAIEAGSAPRPLGIGAGVVAISPDGRSVLVQRLGTTESDLALVDIATGELIARASHLANPGGADVGALQLGGTWFDDEVVAAGTTFSGLITLNVMPNGIVLRGVTALSTEEFPMGLNHPSRTPNGQAFVAPAVIPATGPSDHPHGEIVICAVPLTACTSVAPDPTFVGAAYSVVRVGGEA
jgi:hypothetical protein